MVRNYIMAAIVAIMTIGSMQGLRIVGEMQGGSQGQIRLNTDGNEVGITDSDACHYSIANDLVTCGKRGISTQVIAVDQRSGTRRMNPGKGKYVGMYVKKPSEGTSGAGIDTYVYTVEGILGVVYAE